MMNEENLTSEKSEGVITESCSPIKSDSSRASTISRQNTENDLGLATCRVCHCVESDKRGDAVLGFLSISPHLQGSHRDDNDSKTNSKKALKDVEGDQSFERDGKLDSGFVEFISPEGEVFVCCMDIETGSCHHQDTLIELGCSCKNDLALVHYACALKWFINHGSTVCEICGCVATNIISADIRRVLASLKEYEELRERTANGIPNPAQVHYISGVDPDAIAAIRRHRLSEISSWFNPHNNNMHNNNNNNAPAISQVVAGQPSNAVSEEVTPRENPATKWAVEGTGILLATGLLTVTLVWLIAPRVGKRTAKNGLHILLGGVCALTVVVFFRFAVITRIKYGPARYWAILFVFWFLAFGIWASRTHRVHTT
ncbi:hypothetical protein Nepgr_013233 [Nepenthes gracilis]|uniref:RING-CH-type domain-containing protein n=1 Tax=Nepenthes gracilis TaxID=150966 RepID=A0AAD3SHQ8_NEPGR|nr:hypothetical protein Nepgr_013233 [Nepenthes gracilis]